MASAPITRAQIPSAGTYQIDPTTSSVRFTVRHLFGLRSASGTLAVTSGEIVIAEPIGASQVSAAVATASFTTDTAKRDKHVKTADFLDADQHPEIRFDSTAVVRDGSTWLVRGQLTARGVAAPVEFTVAQATADGAGMMIRATGRVDRYAHEVVKMKGMIARYLDLELTARATRS